MTDFEAPQFELLVDVPLCGPGHFEGRHPFISVYQPMSTPFQDRQEYSIFLPQWTLPSEVWPMLYRPRAIGREDQPHYHPGPWVSCRGRARPEVLPVTRAMLEGGLEDLVDTSEAAFDLLADELRRLDARNLPRDRVFDRRHLRVSVRCSRYGAEGGESLVLGGRLGAEMMDRMRGKLRLSPLKVWVFLED